MEPEPETSTETDISLELSEIIREFRISNKQLDINPFDRKFLTIGSKSKHIMSRDGPQWKELRDEELQYISSLSNNGQFLPAGTLLYHGTLCFPFVPGSNTTGNRNAMTFFGLDITIAMWYVLELMYKSIYNTPSQGYKRFGYLYVFELKEDLPITKIIKTIHKNPKDTWRCKRGDNVCIGPQVSLRYSNEEMESDEERALSSEDSNLYYDLSTEITLFYDKHKDKFGEPKYSFLIDPFILAEHKYDKTFDVRKAIVEEIDTQDPSEKCEEVITPGIYNDKYMLEDEKYGNFFCGGECGYSGKFLEVWEHEEKCVHGWGGEINPLFREGALRKKQYSKGKRKRKRKSRRKKTSKRKTKKK